MAHKDLQHLTRSQVNELIERYYSGENMSALLNDYDLDVPAVRLFSLLPATYVTSDKDECEFCSVHLIAQRKSRTAVKLSPTDFYCPKCGHKPFVDDCGCARCTQKRNDEIKRRRELIFDAFKPSEAPAKFDAITFRDKVYLGILSKTVMDDSRLIGPMHIYHSAGRISPIKEYTHVILSRLIEDKLIRVNPETELCMFNCQSPNFPYDFNMDYVEYLLDMDEEEIEDSLKILAEGDFYDPKTDVKGASELWKELAVEECLEYLTYHAKDVGFGCPPQQKSRAMLSFLLDSFSVSQVFFIIYSCIFLC